MSAFNKNVEKQATAAQRAAQSQNSGNDTALLRRMFGGQPQSRSTSEALGRGFREFILPMIVSAAKGWKENYDLRGDFKARGAEILEKLKRGETLSEAEQDLYDRYAAKYPKELAALQPSQPTQTAPQAAPQAQPSALSAAAQQYANQMEGMDFWNQPNYTSAVVNNYPADEASKILGAEVPPLNLTGERLAQEATENAYNLANGRTDELNNLLRMFGR